MPPTFDFEMDTVIDTVIIIFPYDHPGNQHILLNGRPVSYSDIKTGGWGQQPPAFVFTTPPVCSHSRGRT